MYFRIDKHYYIQHFFNHFTSCTYLKVQLWTWILVWHYREIPFSLASLETYTNTLMVTVWPDSLRLHRFQHGAVKDQILMALYTIGWAIMWLLEVISLISSILQCTDRRLVINYLYSIGISASFSSLSTALWRVHLEAFNSYFESGCDFWKRTLDCGM